MKKISEQDIDEIRKWIYRNARPLELSMWQFHFERGSLSNVLQALSAYQNGDGGFGNAMEPDNWNPNSTPYTTLHAINILKSVGFDDSNHPIMQGIFNYLKSGAHYSGNLWLFSIPANDGFAHAPWWTYSKEANETESIGLTLEISCFVLEHFDKNEELYARAASAIEGAIGKLSTLDRFGDMGIGGYYVLAETLHRSGAKTQFSAEAIMESVKKLISGSIERDTSKWVVYGIRPSNYIHSPESLFYTGNEDIVQTELDYLIETRPGGEVWGLPWSWFENDALYPKQFAISENWWRAYKAIEKLIFLRNFGRLKQEL